MSDVAPYHAHVPDDDFWGAGPAPPITDTAQCPRCAGEMRVVVDAVTIGRPPIASWSWVCRACTRAFFGGRWQE